MFYFYVYYSGAANNLVYFGVYNWVDADYDAIEFSSYWNVPVGSLYSMAIYIDLFAYVASSVTSHVTSQYRYVSALEGEHRLDISNLIAANEIELAVPRSWILVSINPTARYYKIEDNYLVNETLPTLYQIDFFDNISRVFAIDDVSDDFLENVGFENGWNDDWDNDDTLTFENIALNQSIVFEGSSSLRLESSDAPGDYLHYKIEGGYGSGYDIAAGDYYLGFSYYFESFLTSTFFNFSYYTDSQFIYIPLNDTTNRWQQFFIEIHLEPSSTGHDIYFRAQSWKGVVFIDNFRFYKSNIQARTKGYGKYEFSFASHGWDNRLNPVDSGYCNFSLIDRTLQTTIYTWNHTNQRLFEYRNDLEQKEYILQLVYSNGNITEFYFTPQITSYHDFAIEKYYNNLLNFSAHWGYDGWDWVEETTEAWAEPDGADVNETINGFYCVEKNTTQGAYVLLYTPVVSINASYYDYLSMRIKSENANMQINVYDYGLNALGSYVNLSTSYTVINFNLSADADWSGTEKRLYFRINYGDDINRIWLDYVRVLHIDSVEFYESSTYFVLNCEENSDLFFRVWLDSIFTGDYVIGQQIFKNASLGQHNFSVITFMASEQYVFLPIALQTHIYQITVEFAITTLVFSYDVTFGSISTTYYSLWLNTSYRLSDNETWLGDAQSEGSVTWAFQTTVGYHNISLVIYNGLTVVDTVEFGFTILAPLIYWQVFFTFVDQNNLPLYFEFGKCYVNGSQQLSQYLTLVNGSLIHVNITDNFNQLLLNQSYTVTSDLVVSVDVTVYQIVFLNAGSYPSEVIIYKDSVAGYNFSIASLGSQPLYFLAGNYLYDVFYRPIQSVQNGVTIVESGKTKYGDTRQFSAGGDYAVYVDASAPSKPVDSTAAVSPLSGAAFDVAFMFIIFGLVGIGALVIWRGGRTKVIEREVIHNGKRK
ncbi:MAG: hypothetical protein ACFFCI_00740 [Promethearchaeota archaeon]